MKKSWRIFLRFSIGSIALLIEQKEKIKKNKHYSKIYAKRREDKEKYEDGAQKRKNTHRKHPHRVTSIVINARKSLFIECIR